MSCNICVEKYNKSTRLEIKCNYCEFSNCRTCFQKYLLETQDPYCMNCKKIFTRDFVIINCTSTFINNDYKRHREEVLLDREKSLMPATQVYVILEREKNKRREQIKEIETHRSLLLAQVRNLDLKINDLNHRILTNVTEQEIKRFIRKCPMENCRGFLTQQWKCGVCDSKICNKCNEENTVNHECDPGKVETMNLLNRDTKPCPECGTMIFRISGCNQMFCIECHCSWNWNTGLVEKGIIHNPHYYEFIRNGGTVHRNHGDIPCGGLPEIQVIRRELIVSLKRFDIITVDQENILYNFHNCITHIEHYEIIIITDQNEETTRKLRVDYMMNKISETDFKKSLQQIEKGKNKKRDFNNIYEMFRDVSSDIYRQLMVHYHENFKNRVFKNPGLTKQFVIENITILSNLRNYFNDNLKKLGNNYKCVYPGISDDYRFQYNYKTYLKNN